MRATPSSWKRTVSTVLAYFPSLHAQHRNRSVILTGVSFSVTPNSPTQIHWQSLQRNQLNALGVCALRLKASQSYASTANVLTFAWSVLPLAGQGQPWTAWQLHICPAQTAAALAVAALHRCFMPQLLLDLLVRLLEPQGGVQGPPEAACPLEADVLQG